MNRTKLGWILLALLVSWVSSALAEHSKPIEEEFSSLNLLSGYSSGTATRTPGVESWEMELLSVEADCDGTCMKGQPCLCPVGCTCRTPPICHGVHYEEITWQQVYKNLVANASSLTKKFGFSVSGSILGKAAAEIDVDGTEGVDVSGKGEGKGKGEGYEKEETTERKEESRKLEAGGKLKIGTEECAPAGVLLEIRAKATLRVQVAYESIEWTATTLNWSAWWRTGTTSGTQVQYRGAHSVGVHIDNNSTATICPCQSVLKKGERSRMPTAKEKENIDKGVFLGGGEKTSYIGIRVPEGGGAKGSGSGFTVQVDGKPVSKDNFKVTPGTTDPTIAVVSIRHRTDPSLGATITVVDPEKRVHRTLRPPDRIQLVNKVHISRGETSTTITVAPEVNTEGPDGTKRNYKDGESPTGTPPGVFIRDDKRGFWKGLGDFINRTLPGVLIPLTTGYLFNPGGSQSGAVPGSAVGVTKIEVPNDEFDKAMDQANKVDPNFGLTDVAHTLETGTGLSQGTVSLSGFSVTNYYVMGGSPFEVRSGSQVAFLVSGVKGAVSQAQVALRGAQGPLGYMQVLSVMPAGPGKAVVEATFGTVPDNGDPFWGAVTLNGRTSNEVPFMASPGSVDVVALQKVVTEGGKVAIMLRATGGFKIKGTLTLAGPGVFVENNGKRIDVDAAGSISYDVHTRFPGLITATFTPERNFKYTEDMIKLLELAGLTMKDIGLD